MDGKTKFGSGQAGKLPLLTIAIPTYNRSRYLSRLLDSLMPQLEGTAGVVDLVISDNASPDDTPALLETYRSRGLLFRSIRNETNIGPDRNFTQCFDEAAGKYVWIIGDDDVLVPDTLSVILGILVTDEYDIVHLRGKELGGGQLSRSHSGSVKIEVIEDPLKFAIKTHIFLTFITANIINKSRVLSLPHRPFSELDGTNLGQLSWTYTAVRYLRKGVYVSDPLIAAGIDDRGGYETFTVFGTNLKRIAEEWLVEPQLVRIIMNGAVQTFLPACVLHSKQGPQMSNVDRVLMEQRRDALLKALFSENYRYYLFLYPLMLLPAKLGRIWLLLCRIINRSDKALGNPMLR